jgi:hypothetical protein
MKTLTVRLTDDEHARLKADADTLRVGMAPYLLNLWESDADKPNTQPQQSSVENRTPYKNINLKVPVAEHARMVAAAKRELLPLTALLRRLFAAYERNTPAIAPKTRLDIAPPKLKPKERAVIVDKFTPTPSPHREEVWVCEKTLPSSGRVLFFAVLRDLDGVKQVLPDSEGRRAGFLTLESAKECAVEYIARQHLE